MEVMDKLKKNATNHMTDEQTNKFYVKNLRCILSWANNMRYA